ncbi:hypothetical protein BU24DRAFT_426693 [Aaosphaeria arxii CBS 175.79]|uniref:Uncharacterized protein n=1 Tax=Aaosphaeria arxii CBS 175.79 TaxID=1450172 RepID=A0A6A5XFH8_9PLEO|nr:uncharacterized protein BU24DRAFT_426693 [Aaosphaeria arxii CBS 175.79]KAF2011619.1 hypothetical protein BU24DRAFT_426693 [Aaosphaeria arxii CBS 175.79]
MQTQFHHYQPNPQRQSAPVARNQITGPFQIPRVPHPWPYGRAQDGSTSGGSGHGAIPIDPQLLGQGQQGGNNTNNNNNGQTQGQWHHHSGGNGNRG